MSDGGEGHRQVDKRQHWDATMSKGFGAWSPLVRSPNDQDGLHGARKANPETTRPSTSDGSRSLKRRHIVDMLMSGNSNSPARNPGQNAFPSPNSIGVALGSPGQSPWTTAANQRPSLESNIPPSAFNATSRAPNAVDPSLPQRKKSIFNSIFSRKSSNASQTSSYKAQALQSPSTPATAWQQYDSNRRVEEGTITTITASPLVTPRWNDLGRRPSTGRLLRKSSKGLRPRPQKSATTPVESIKSPLSTLQSPKPSPTDSSIISPAISPIPRIPPESPFIDVAIPDVAMERYSVMFSDVLKQRKPLLARRQTQLKELQLSSSDAEGGILDVITQSPELLLVRRATIPSPRSPRLALHPSTAEKDMPPTSQTILSQQRAGLSRSNTLPSPVREDSMNGRTRSKSRKGGIADQKRSPTLESDASMSLQSDGSTDVSEISELSDDNTFEDIIIQLEDLSMTNGLNIQHYPPPLFSTSTAPATDTTLKKHETPMATLYQPNLPFDKPRVGRQDEVKHSPRTSSRAQLPSNQNSQTQLKSHTTALQARPQPPTPTNPAAILRSTPQATTTAMKSSQRPLPPLNPLQSSPASPVEITLARQLSLSRSRGLVTSPLSPLSAPIAKTARQPHPTTIVNPDNFLEANRDWRAPLPKHMRNKSEYVVVESV